MRSAATASRRPQEQPLVAKHIEGTAHRRYLSSPHAATLHGKIQGFVLRLPPQNMAHATFMQPFQCDLQPQLQETQRTTPTGTTTRCKTHRRNQSRPEQPQPHPPHTRGTFHRRLQPLYTEKTRFRAPASSPTQSPCTIPMRSATSPLPSFITTSLRHHFPSSPLPIVTTSSTSLHRHFPSSPLPFVTTSLRHHFPSSPLPFVTTSLRHHFPLSPLPFVTTSHRHRFPSSPLPFVTTSLCHHFPSSPLPFIAFYSFVMYCDTEPPFIALFLRDVYL